MSDLLFSPAAAMSTTRKDGRGKRAAARDAEATETPLVKRLAMERKDPYACFKEASPTTVLILLRLPCTHEPLSYWVCPPARVPLRSPCARARSTRGAKATARTTRTASLGWARAKRACGPKRRSRWRTCCSTRPCSCGAAGHGRPLPRTAPPPPTTTTGAQRPARATTVRRPALHF